MRMSSQIYCAIFFSNRQFKFLKICQTLVVTRPQGPYANLRPCMKGCSCIFNYLDRQMFTVFFFYCLEIREIVFFVYFPHTYTCPASYSVLRGRKDPKEEDVRRFLQQRFFQISIGNLRVNTCRFMSIVHIPLALYKMCRATTNLVEVGRFLKDVCVQHGLEGPDNGRRQGKKRGGGAAP